MDKLRNYLIFSKQMDKIIVKHFIIILFSIPEKLDKEICTGSDVDRLQHYGQLFGENAAKDVASQNEINPALFFDEDVDKNTLFCLSLFAKENSFAEFRKTGVHRIKV